MKARKSFNKFQTMIPAGAMKESEYTKVRSSSGSLVPFGGIINIGDCCIQATQTTATIIPDFKPNESMTS